MSSLSATARVILGLLKYNPRTGYDIKRVTDYSTRFFWRASYGQIYPELRGLEQSGLVRAREEPYGRRQRRVYELTPKGERALTEWLRSESDVYELRDEGLLRLFFGELVPPDELLALVTRRREVFESHAGLFRTIAEELGEIDGPSAEVLRYGIELTDWNVRWWGELEKRLAAQGDG
jgi:DNA-binding PadR family transcriptional regulator